MRIATLLVCLCAGILMGTAVEYVNPLLVIGVIGLCLLCIILYLVNFELLILILLLINHEVFYLTPREWLGAGNYQDLLFVVLPLGVLYFLKREHEDDQFFKYLVIIIPVFVMIGVINTYLQGQSFMLGFKAAKAYFLITFYFLFATKRINLDRLYKYVIITGVVLTILNNLQYMSGGSISLFNYYRSFTSLELRAGMYRFLVGDFFTIFAPLVSFAMYLTKRKMVYLLASLYMVLTVVMQGQVRAIMIGFGISGMVMLLLSRRINVKKLVLVGLPISVICIILSSLVMQHVPFFKDIYNVTQYEVRQQEGGFGIRLAGYDYYLNQIWESPLLGKGVWNDAYEGDNPENMRRYGIHLSDIGLTRFVFHFGLLGVLWMVSLLFAVYRTISAYCKEATVNGIHGIIGYFIFGIATLVTLNCFLDRRTIIYLALALSILNSCTLRDSHHNASI